MPDLLAQLLKALQQEAIRFCHWKSNFHLEADLREGEELDLLVDRLQAQLFERILAELNFKRALDPVYRAFPAVCHFYGLDHGSGKLLHLHVYYRITTGESLIKNYAFPVEEAFLTPEARHVGAMPLPPAPAELMLFVIRAMIKHTSPGEYLKLRGRNREGYEDLRNELQALFTPPVEQACLMLLGQWLPSVDPNLFKDCLWALKEDAPFARRLGLAFRLRAQLKPYSRLSDLQALSQQVEALGLRFVRRLRRAGRSKQLATGGAIIAFIGPEATGKSTLVKETARWLGKIFQVRTVHLGKPPATWLTYWPDRILPFVKRLAPPAHPSHRPAPTTDSQPESASLLYSLRAVLLAWERLALATHIRQRAANGEIIICDRYPSTTVGAMDSARLSVTPNTSSTTLHQRLARLEQALYRQIPPADLIIQLTVPVEVAMERNRARQKQEDTTYLIRRHTQSIAPVYPHTHVVVLNSDQPQEQTIQQACQMIWAHL